MRLSTEAQERLGELITRHNLHGQLPVPIKQVALDEGWEVAYSGDLAPFYGYAMIAPYARMMRINGDVPLEQQRFTIGHELGHWINADPPGLHECREMPLNWWAKRRAGMEARASLVAAKLLVPHSAFEAAEDEIEVAVRCQVPVTLVRLAASEMQRDYPQWGRWAIPLDRHEFGLVAGIALSAITLAGEFRPDWQDAIPSLGTISGLF